MAVIQYLLDTAQIWLKSSFRPKLKFDKQKFRYHFGFGINLTITNIINILFQNLYVIYIGKVFSPATLGLYTRAESLKNFPVKNIMNILKRVLVPFFSNLDSDEQLKNYYKKILSTVMFLLSPLLVVLIFQAENIVLVLLTEKWLQAVPFLQIICLGAFLHPLSEYNINMLIVKGQSNMVLKLEIYKKIITISVFLISVYWGIYGLLVGQVINSVIIYMLNSFYTKQLLKYSNLEQIKDVFPYIISSLLLALSIHYMLRISMFFNGNDFLEIITFTILLLGGYLLLSKMLNFEAFRLIVNIYKRRK
jgi:O-antigen/teichoic acid export membrane protein